MVGGTGPAWLTQIKLSYFIIFFLVKSDPKDVLTLISVFLSQEPLSATLKVLSFYNTQY